MTHLHWCFGIVWSCYPLIVGNIGVQWAKSSGQPCSEGADCVWAQIPSFADYTVPLGGILLLIYIPMWLMTNYKVTESEEKNAQIIEDSNDADEP